MTHLEKTTFICLDCETTGLDPVKDQIIEVGVLKFTFENEVDQFESLINPHCEIPETSIKIHHITPEMVADKPVIEEVLPHLLEMIGPSIIIGHGIGFDVMLLINAAERLQMPCQLTRNRQIDTLRLARHYGECPVNSLEQLRRHFNVPAEGAHRAMGDVLVNAEVFKHLCRKFRTTDQIFELLSKPIQIKIMPLGPHKGRPLKEIPLDYLHWAANKDFDQDLLFSIRTELKRRKQGNLFTQTANPFNTL